MTLSDFDHQGGDELVMCRMPTCENPAEHQYRLRGDLEPVWLCEDCVRLAQRADSEDGTLGELNPD